MLEDRSDGLIVVWMNVAQQHDGELNAWYEGEHVAEIAGLPGVHAVRRYLNLAHSCGIWRCLNAPTIASRVEPRLLA